jgi:hypothetical protein
MSIRQLLIASRTSGPAVEYVTEPDGSRTIVAVHPARDPRRAPRLSIEQALFLLITNGAWPEEIPAPGFCGVQAHDYDLTRRYADSGRGDRETWMAMHESGIMAGYQDERAGRHPSFLPAVDKT